MSNKPEIQYVGQFFVYGSEAKKIAVEESRKEKKAQLPLPDLDKERVIRIEPSAIAGIVVAMAMFVVMILGALQIQSAWQEFRVAKTYLEQVRMEHRAIEAQYQESYDLEDVKTVAEKMGLIPVHEAQHVTIALTLPEPEPVRTQWDDFVWFMQGLFADA